MPAAQETPTGLVTASTQPALNPESLPHKDDPSLTLEVGTIAEYEQTWRLNFGEWKGFLSEGSYLDRELYLGDAELTRNGRATAWILTSPTLPNNADGTRPILACCETLVKDAYVAKDGKVEKILSHGIGSVYCRPEYRGKGYGVKMIKDLGVKLETFQQLKNNREKFSVLYSDIGLKFYAKFGWKPFPSSHISLKPLDVMQYDRIRLQYQLPPVEDLRVRDVKELPTVSQLEAKLSIQSKAEPTKTFVAFRPDMAHFDWHFRREEFLAEILGREQPDVKGAIERQSGAALIWSRTYGAQSSAWHLNVLYVYIPNEASSSSSTPSIRNALAGLILRAQREADAWDLEAGVEIWDPKDDIVAAAKMIASEPEDVQIVERDQEHVCSLKWNGPETDEIVWLANERYAWC